MAGEVEECGSYQADNLPTGSISFGRFESETLSWEKRSSFSHNRYLEEVEKYATPGSVTRKKAYFEAHFKSKGLLYQSSSGKKYEAECQTTGNVDEEKSGYIEYVENEDGALSRFACYDDTPSVSDEQEEVGCEQEEVIALSSLPEDNPCNGERAVNFGDDVLQNDDTVQIQSILSDNDHGYTLQDQNVGEKLKATRSKKIDNCTEVKEPNEHGSFKTKSRRQMSVVKNSSKCSIGKSSIASSKIKSLDEVEKVDNLRPGSGKRLPLRISRSSDLGRKPKDIQNTKPEVKQVNLSENGLRQKNHGFRHHQNFQTSEVEQPAYRSMKVFDSAKVKVKQNNPVVSFKSDERADKRKEFIMKLEEKLHAKEAEMNEIQAQTQEEKEAAIKLFRKSLNFKATPLPSFYNGVVPRVSDVKKVASTPPKPVKMLRKCTAPANRTATREKPPSSAGPILASRQDCPTSVGDHDYPLVPAKGSDECQPSMSAVKSQGGKKVNGRRLNVVGRQ